MVIDTTISSTELFLDAMGFDFLSQRKINVVMVARLLVLSKKILASEVYEKMVSDFKGHGIIK